MKKHEFELIRQVISGLKLTGIIWWFIGFYLDSHLLTIPAFILVFTALAIAWLAVDIKGFEDWLKEK